MGKTHLLSLLVHEAPDVIENQIQNTLHFLPNSSIVLHFGLCAALLRPQFLANYRNHPRVFINDQSLPTAWAWILHAQLSNYFFAKRIGIPFDFYIMDSSNSLFFRHGTEDFLANTQVDFCLNPMNLNDPNFNSHWVKLHSAVNDPCFISLVNDLPGSVPKFCRHEGAAFKAALMEEMVKIICKHYTPRVNEIFYGREEIYWATTACHLSNNYADVLTITADLNPQIISDLRSKNLPGLKTFEPWKDTDERYFSNKFAVKPVARNMQDPLRMYITDLVSLDTSSSQSYSSLGSTTSR